MTIHLPNDLESSINAAVQSGYFASVDDAMTEAARLLLSQIQQRQASPLTIGKKPPLGSIGAMRDSADELDEIVAEAYRQRRTETWRELDL